MEPYPSSTLLKSKVYAVALFLCAGLFFFTGITLFHRPGVAIFMIGLATLFISVAVNPVALETPSEGFNWKLIPMRAKILQCIATACFLIGESLY
jgi:hypothetical protein